MPGFNVGNTDNNCGSLQDYSELNISNTLETARSNRFFLSINGPVNVFDVNNNQFVMSCKSISRPPIKIEKEQVFQGADYMNVPLRATYEPIEIVFYDVLQEFGSSDLSSVYSDFTSQKILSWWTRGVFDPFGSRVTFPESRRTTVTIWMTQGDGLTVWKYALSRAWPELIVPTETSYESGAILTTRLTVVYDKLREVKLN